jgi:hypothetical protein
MMDKHSIFPDIFADDQGVVAQASKGQQEDLKQKGAIWVGDTP